MSDFLSLLANWLIGLLVYWLIGLLVNSLMMDCCFWLEGDMLMK